METTRWLKNSVAISVDNLSLLPSLSDRQMSEWQWMCVCRLTGIPDGAASSCVWRTCVWSIILSVESRQPVYHCMWPWWVLRAMGLERWGLSCLSVFVHLSSLFVFLFVFLPACLSVCLSFFLCVYLSVCPSVCLPACVCVTVYVSVSLSVCLATCVSLSEYVFVCTVYKLRTVCTFLVLSDMGFASEVLSVGWRQSDQCRVVCQRSEVCLWWHTRTVLRRRKSVICICDSISQIVTICTVCVRVCRWWEV